MEQIDVSYPDHITIHTVKNAKSLFDFVVVSIKKQGITMTYSIPVLQSEVRDIKNS
jgi:hypothetical protein